MPINTTLVFVWVIRDKKNAQLYSIYLPNMFTKHLDALQCFLLHTGVLTKTPQKQLLNTLSVYKRCFCVL